VRTIREAFAYLWDLKAKRIFKLEAEARHPYAKIQDKVEAQRGSVGRKGLVPHPKKGV